MFVVINCFDMLYRATNPVWKKAPQLSTNFSFGRSRPIRKLQRKKLKAVEVAVVASSLLHYN